MQSMFLKNKSVKKVACGNMQEQTRVGEVRCCAGSKPLEALRCRKHGSYLAANQPRVCVLLNLGADCVNGALLLRLSRSANILGGISR